MSLGRYLCDTCYEGTQTIHGEDPMLFDNWYEKTSITSPRV